MSVVRALVQGARAVTASAGYAAAIVLLGGTLLWIVVEEVVGSDDFDLLARGSVVSLSILVLVCALGEPLRIAADRALLLRDALRAAEGTTPPDIERRPLETGPHPALMPAGIAGIIVGGICLPIGALLAADDREALLARVLVPVVAAVLLAGGIVIVRWSRGRGRGRQRWEERLSVASARWAPPVRPVPRAHEQRRFRVLEISAIVCQIGVYVFLGGVLMRQPGRFADRRTWDEPGEQAIDGLIASGALVIAIPVAIAFAAHGALLLWAAIRDGRTVRALERGQRVRLEHVDAVLLDAGPLERASVITGVIGWVVASYGWSPLFMAGIESSAAVEHLLPLRALSLPGLAVVAAAWLMGGVGAARSRARRARVQAVLLRDPLPAEDGHGPTDRSAVSVRDTVLLADRPRE